MTNHRSASNAWGLIKKKLFADVPSANGNTPNGSAKKRKAPAPKTPKKKVFDSDDDDEGNDME
jgi:hypothetical protein